MNNFTASVFSKRGILTFLKSDSYLTMQTNSENIKGQILKSILYVFVLLNLTTSNAQNISFKKLGFEEGLSEQAGLCIHQDHLNRMWIGTRNGLNCWDGVRMKTFYPLRGDTTSVAGHKITDLLQTDNYLWVLSEQKISRLDLETFSFQQYGSMAVRKIGVYNKSLLVSTRNGLYIYDKQKDIFNKSGLLPDYNELISAIYQDENKTLWLSSDNARQLIKISSDNIEVIDIPIASNLIVNDLYVDSKNRLWIATRYHGLWAYNIESKSFDTVDLNSSPYFIESLSVRKVIEDKNKRLWVGTFKGLAIFDLNKETTSFIRANDDEHSLSHNSVFSLYLSNDDNIWIGTYFGGINYGRVANQVFTHYDTPETGEPSYPVIGKLIEDNNNIWIATEGGGLDYFDREKNTFKNVPFTADETGLLQTNLKSLFRTKQNQLLVGTYQGGLNVLDVESKKFKYYNPTNFEDRPYHVNDIVEYEGDYLLATEKGVIRFNHEREAFTSFIKTENNTPAYYGIVTSLYIDSKNILWIGTSGNGLFTYNLNTEKLKKYTSNDFDSKSIGSNSVNEIMEDHRFRLWLGCDGGGLCLYNRNEDNFTSFTQQKDNLPSDFIYGISESRFGNLWIATSKGLSRFDVENNLFFNYTSESGFPLQELNYKSLLLTKSGELFVGGIEGLISFNERDLLMVNEDMKIHFSNLFVNNEEVRANDASNILTKDISVAKAFVLKPQHTVFSINFTSFNYNNNLNNKYQYQLEGFNDDWVSSEFNTTATYTNLNPGKYTFKVRACDVAYTPITEEKSIQITVKPPLSRTWYAYTFYGLIFFGLILLFNNFYLGKVRALYQLKNERAEKNRIEELNVHKLRFFTNISHEFMTPLTIILSSLENAFGKYKIPTKLHWQLNLAFRNAKRLKNLNSELLDFRKIEQGHLKLKVQENNIIPYLQEIYEAFEGIARQKNIKYTLSKNVNHLPVFYDARHMDKVFYNLLSNAINHVPEESGEITIQLNNKPDAVEIKVIDNGTGIPKDDVEKVFNRFFHHDSKYTESQYHGSGIGLALSQSIVKAHRGSIICESEENQGTTFTVTLLKGSKHISEEHISDKQRSNQFSIDTELILASEDHILDDDSENTEQNNVDAPMLLIVDDNAEIRFAVKNLFVDSYQIKTANDGVDGLEKALDLQPDIIISDVLMPKLSGFDMCEKLKRNLNTSHIPILLLTALDSEEDRTIAFKHGADSYCTKPFNAEMLKARIENLFKNRANLQQKFSTEPGASTKSVTQNIVDRDFLKKTQAIVEDNFLNNDFNVDEFAAEMNLGRTIFYSKVKTITGQTPNEYIQTIRLKKAADMLLNDTTKNVSEIAYDTGFNSPRYFALAFKKHFGVNPSKYIKNT